MLSSWEFHERQRKMSLTTSIFNNVLQSSGFSEAERLAREAIQNSVDAHRVDASAPVSVRIEKRTLVGEEKVSLVKALDLDNGPKDRREHFDLAEGNSLESIEDPDEPLSVLIIADHYTHGLPGKWDGTKEGDHFGRLVVNLGVDDKAEGSEISGGSFGFGKTVYGKASKIGVVAFYSVFNPSSETNDAHARFMATGLFKAHDYGDKCYDGFAFLGEPDEEHENETVPFVDGQAHEIADRCGLRVRSPKESGTTILIVDCDQEIQDLRRAAEVFWWPRIVRGELDLVFIENGEESFPRPKKNPDILPFIECQQNLISESVEPPKEKLFEFRRLTTEDGPKQLGTLSCKLLDVENKYTNRVALVRGPGMVVEYYSAGIDAYENCVGVFISKPDIEKILTYSEPQMHNIWDENADRLKRKFGKDGTTVVRSVINRIRSNFVDFQRLQEPPIPPGGLQPKELSKLLGRFLDASGETPEPPPPPAPRPISIHVLEDRTIEDEMVWDAANISLELHDDQDTDELTCEVTVHYELIGDSSLRVVERLKCELIDNSNEICGKGAPAITKVVVKKGEPVRFKARALSEEVAMTRFRVSVEEVI